MEKETKSKKYDFNEQCLFILTEKVIHEITITVGD